MIIPTPHRALKHPAVIATQISPLGSRRGSVSNRSPGGCQESLSLYRDGGKHIFTHNPPGFFLLFKDQTHVIFLGWKVFACMGKNVVFKIKKVFFLAKNPHF